MTISLLQLWMPILLGAFLAWIASALIHVVAKYHNSDYQAVSNEDEVMAAIRNGSPKLGIHSLPYCEDMSEMNKPEVQEKFNKGPVAILAVFPNGLPNMGKLMPQHLAFGWAMVPMSIWYGHPWSSTVKYLLDALIYGLVVGGSFAWLWPA